MTRVLVTGASGFIGRALVADLARRGFAVRDASRRPVPAQARGVEPAILPDLAGPVDWAPLLAGVDLVVHLAAIAHTDASAPYDAVNHRAVAGLAQAASGRVGRLVFVSSVRAQIGASAPGVLTEADPPRPTDAYGRAKLAGEAVLLASGAPAVVLRPVLVAGPGAGGNLATLLRVARLPLPLPFGALEGRRSIVALPDLCAAIAHVLGADVHLGRTYLVAHPEPISVAGMLAALREGLGRRPALVAVPPAWLRAALRLARAHAQTDRLFGELVVSPASLMATGWTPAVTPRQALATLGAGARRS